MCSWRELREEVDMRAIRGLLKLSAVLLVVLGLVAGVLAWRGSATLAKRWNIEPTAGRAGDLVADLAEGERQAKIRGCLECHGADLGGQVLALTPVGALIPPNLTRGQGGVTAAYSDDDWQRAIRHGVGPGGRPLILMPSDDNTTMSEADFASLLAYLKSVAPVDRQLEPTALTLLGKVLLGAGQLPLLTVERIDHSLQPQSVAVAATVEYGGYVARICSGCHGSNFAGGPIPGQPPDMPAAANLTPKGAMKDWTLTQFTTALRTGVRPDGRKMEPQNMPWTAFSAMTDTEVEALYRYFQSIPAADRRP
jgi:mono/diheme cytochrome c family protein